MYDDATETQYVTSLINRNNFNLTASQKRRVDRHGRIKKYQELNPLIFDGRKTLQRQEPDGLKNYRLHTEVLQPIFNRNGTTPIKQDSPLNPKIFTSSIGT